MFTDKDVATLIKLYEKAEKDIINEITKAVAKGNNTQYLFAMRSNIRVILADLDEGARDWCGKAIPRVYGHGAASRFGAIHQQAVKVLADNSFNRFKDVSSFIGRRVDDIYRTLALENLTGAVVGYNTAKQVANKYKEALLEKGVTGFKDKLGREWNMTTYTKMVARTTLMEADLEGTKNRLIEQGRDLVRVTTHLGSCEKCAPWQGKILSLTGRTPGYPTLADARAKGLYHPNCKHDYGLFADLDAEIEQLEKELKKDSSGRISINETTSTPHKDALKEIPMTLKNINKNISNWYNKEIAPFINSSDKAVEMIHQINEGLKKLVEENDFCMRVPGTSVLRSIMKDGKFKSQFETNTSRGTLNTRVRKNASNFLFGTNIYAVDAKDFEKYGYLGSKDIKKDFVNSMAGQYGDIVIRFKKESLQDRTTLTVGDSLIQRMVAVPTTDPSAACINRYRLQDSAEEYAIKLNKSTDVSTVEKDLGVRYFELQYHGDLLIEDIKSISTEYALPKDIMDKLKELGIEHNLIS